MNENISTEGTIRQADYVATGAEMNHEDHIALLRGGILDAGGVWADLGSGSGAFTLALADLLGSGAEIYSVDLDRRALRQQRDAMRTRFPGTALQQVVADFAQPLDLPPLDGIVMANSLHYHRDKLPVLRQIYGYLKPGGRLILVEYNADRGNPWVPHPLSYHTWESLVRRAGFVDTRLLATVPSRFLGQIYAALSLRPPASGR